jgi:hypothetical protein
MPSLKVVRQSLVAKVVVRKHVYKVNGQKKKEKKQSEQTERLFRKLAKKPKNQDKNKGFFSKVRKSQLQVPRLFATEHGAFPQFQLLNAMFIIAWRYVAFSDSIMYISFKIVFVPTYFKRKDLDVSNYWVSS